MNQVFCSLDDGKATLRILNTLDRRGTLASRGQLEEMLLRISESYEVQVNNRISALTTLLEPLIIVTMGVIKEYIKYRALALKKSLQNKKSNNVEDK